MESRVAARAPVATAGWPWPARAQIVVERLVGRGSVRPGPRETTETTSRPGRCAHDSREQREGLAPKEVAQVRILPGALANPQVKPLLRQLMGLFLDHL